MKQIKIVERLLMVFACLSMALFAAGYFWGMWYFYGFLFSMAVWLVLWIGFWRCPHCGRRLWYNFDAPCRHCHKCIDDMPEEKLKNTEEETGFFHWKG